MSSLLGFPITVWDYITFASIMTLIFSALFGLVYIAGLPGRIAEKRNHPDTDAIKVMGWMGFLAVVPWVNAFIWAFKPAEVVDVRKMPPDTSAEEKEPAADQAAGEKSDTPAGGEK